MSYETVMTAAKIIATAHPIARGVCKCDTPADVSFKDVASTLLDSGWESVLIADKNLLIANTDVARNDYVNAHPKSKFTIYRRQIDKHGIPTESPEKSPKCGGEIKADKHCTKCMTTCRFVCASLLLQPMRVAFD